MENSYNFYNNTACKYFPCHKGLAEENFNCMFCFCPMYWFDDCLGNPEYITSKSGKKIKNCTNCCFPHVPQNYDKINEFIRQKINS